MAATENDLLQKFINNEKNSKRWTLISVIAFCGFAFGIIYLGNELKNANKKIEINEANLARALDSANSLNDALEANQVSLENMSNNFKQVKREKDSLVNLLNKVTQNNVTPADRINIQAIVRDHRNISYKVYIQYMKAFEAESKSIQSLLPKKYNAPGTELITKFSFGSSVKYFHDSDKEEAQEIADIINNNMGKYEKTPIRIVKTNMNVSRGQLEIWLGQPKLLNTIQIIKKYDSKN